ncbi:MAG: TadE family protein [Pseudomonadota bacterium]
MAFDFVIVLPIYLAFFLASFETGMLMTRQVLLDRGVDQVVRLIRLSTLNPPDYEELRRVVCANSPLVPDCENAVKIEMWRQDPRGTMNFKPVPDCVDREEEVQPASIYELGAQNQIMFVRACVKYEPFFPTATMGGALRDASGEYALISTNIYVTEPNG